MFSVCIILPIDAGSSICGDNDLDFKIYEYFAGNLFSIPFVPKVGMMIDIDDFLEDEEIIKKLKCELAFVTINKIVICKNHINLYCS